MKKSSPFNASISELLAHAEYVYSHGLKKIGVSYLGGVSTSQKTMHSEKMGFDQYCIYMSPWNTSGHQVCPKGQNCHERCLSGAGHSKLDILSGKNIIQKARLFKTEAFYKDRTNFVLTAIHEILKAKKAAGKKNHKFFVRLNGTSDLSPELFKAYGRNLLELFPDVQFIDYTKVLSRVKVAQKYPNYDLTFSYDGYNWDECEKALAQGVRVAMVGDCEMPKTFAGVPVVNGDLSDIRHLDPNHCVVWLKYKSVANDFVNGKYVAPKDPFVVKAGDPRLAY